MKIAILYNTSWGIFNFRSNLITHFIKSGVEVITIAPFDRFVTNLEELGCVHYEINIDSQSKNPIKDLFFCYELNKILKKNKPDVILNFTAKPNIYGTIISNRLGVKIINNIAGLGLGFTRETLMTRVLLGLYSYSQKKADHVLFQNPVDQELFKSKQILNEVNYSLLPGSGVDLNRFKKHENHFEENSKIKFLLVARMLYSKGIFHFFEAAKKLYDEGITNFEIAILGDFGLNSKDAIPKEAIERWSKLPYISYLGRTDNVIPYLISYNCIVLPSYYREGTPRVLLESLAIGRPIITTDMPGCRDTIYDSKNGYLIAPNDVNDLKDKMLHFIRLNNKEKVNMGKVSRQLAESKFDEKFVINKYQEVISSLL